MRYVWCLTFLLMCTVYYASGQNSGQYEVRIEFWTELKGGLNTIRFGKTNGRVCVTSDSTFRYSQYCMNDGYSLSTMYNLLNKTHKVTEGNSMYSDSKHRLNKLLLMIDDIFELDINNLDDANVLSNTLKKQPNTKFFRLGNYMCHSFSKGQELTGVVELINNNVHKVSAIFKTHSATSVCDSRQGALIELVKEK